MFEKVLVDNFSVCIVVYEAVQHRTAVSPRSLCPHFDSSPFDSLQQLGPPPLPSPRAAPASRPSTFPINLASAQPHEFADLEAACVQLHRVAPESLHALLARIEREPTVYMVRKLKGRSNSSFFQNLSKSQIDRFSFNFVFLSFCHRCQSTPKSCYYTQNSNSKRSANENFKFTSRR
jgi:hypothetical protein